MAMKEILDRLAKIASKNPKARRYDDRGLFYPDPTPIAPPIGYTKSPTISEQIRAMVRSEHVRQAADAAGFDTFEEADDFDVGDDYDPTSPFEEQFEGQFTAPLEPQGPLPRDPEDRNPPTPPVIPPAEPAKPAEPPGGTQAQSVTTK